MLGLVEEERLWVICLVSDSRLSKYLVSLFTQNSALDPITNIERAAEESLYQFQHFYCFCNFNEARETVML